MLLYAPVLVWPSYTKESQSQGRARSPLRAAVGRADHGFLGWNPAVRALTSAGTVRAPPCRKKASDMLHSPCGHCGQDGRAPECNNRRYGSRRRETAD